MKISRLMLILAVIATGCTNPKLEQVEALKKEAIEIHDMVMPRMGEMHELGLVLKAYRTENAADTSSSAAIVDGQLRDQIQSLEIASEQMMDWMADYKVDFEKENAEDASIAYYSEQIDLIKEVKQSMEESINGANEFLETFQD